MPKINKEDMVNEPEHYKQHLFQCIDEMVIMFGVEATINYCKCAAWKYRNRAPFKWNPDEDNKKADWYIEKAKKLQEGDLWQERWMNNPEAINCSKRNFGTLNN